MSVSVYLLLGSNLGNRLEHLAQARLEIGRQVGSIVTTSSIYKTAAWGLADQPDFFNQVIVVSTALKPEEVLSKTATIEKKAGRIRKEKWGARVLDIDILFYDNLIMETPLLTIPHAEIQNRRFTLLPLTEVAPDFLHPKIQKTIHQLLLETQDHLPVEKLSL